MKNRDRTVPVREVKEDIEMKKRLALFLSLMMVLGCFTLAFSACGKEAAEDAAEATEEAAGETAEDAAETAEETATGTSEGAALGYDGDDPAELAVYRYLAEQIGSQYDLPDGAVCLPVVRVIDRDDDSDDGDADIEGDFWVYNYVVEGDTLKCISGGAHPGQIELNKTGDGFSVDEFEAVADGGAYEASAKDIFEENYDKFVEVSSDDKGREELRAKGIATYVKALGLPVTKYQDEGWDPVDIPL